MNISVAVKLQHAIPTTPGPHATSSSSTVSGSRFQNLECAVQRTCLSCWQGACALGFIIHDKTCRLHRSGCGSVGVLTSWGHLKTSASNILSSECCGTEQSSCQQHGFHQLRGGSLIGTCDQAHTCHDYSVNAPTCHGNC